MVGARPTADAVGQRVAPGRQRAGVPAFRVRLPGWDDIVHVVPTKTLDAEIQGRRRRRMHAALRASPAPQVVQDFALLAQEIDNVQDALVTLSVLGRVATKIAGRALPGVGQIASAADLLNLINVFYPNTLTTSAVGVLGVAGRKVSGRTKYALSREQKRQLQQFVGHQPGTYRQRLAETLRTGRVGFGWGEALQVLQTTDWLFGFGLSLGPIFGGLQDIFFGLLRGARFDLTESAASALLGVQEAARVLAGPLAPDFDLTRSVSTEVLRRGIRVDFPGVIPLTERLVGLPEGIIEGKLEAVTRPLVGPAARAAGKAVAGIQYVEHATVSAAGRVWRAGKWLVGLRGVLSWEDHVELLVAQQLALQAVLPFLQQVDWPALSHARLREVDPFPPAWVVSGGRPVTRGAVTAALRDGPARLPLDWLDQAPTPEADAFARGLVTTFVEMLFEALEGPQARVEVRSAPVWRAFVTMHDYDLLPPYRREDSEVLWYAERLMDLERAVEGRGRPGLSEVLGLYRQAFPGVPVP